MKRTLILAMAFLLLMSLPIIAQTTEKTLSVGNQPYVEIKTVAGNITVTARDQVGEVSVRSTVKGDHVTPVIEQRDGRIYIREEHEKTGFFSSSGSIDFEVLVPRETIIDAKSVSGNISAEGLAANSELKTVSGDVTAYLIKSVDADLKTVSGDIDCTIDPLYSANLSLRSVSGTVNLALKNGADARFRASCISGDVKCRLSLEDKDYHEGYGTVRLTGRFGGGTGQIRADSISGSVIVK